mgnify:CR=1 FL=1
MRLGTTGFMQRYSTWVRINLPEAFNCVLKAAYAWRGFIAFAVYIKGTGVLYVTGRDITVVKSSILTNAGFSDYYSVLVRTPLSEVTPRMLANRDAVLFIKVSKPIECTGEDLLNSVKEAIKLIESWGTNAKQLMEEFNTVKQHELRQ